MQEENPQESQMSELEEEMEREVQPDTGPVADETMEEVPKPRRRLRRGLLWVVSLVVIFAAGVILTWTLRVQPQAAQIAALEADVLAAQEQIETQEAELADLRPLVEQNALLVSELAATQNHLEILDVLVDVTKAQLALAQEDAIAAEAALEGTAETLATLESTLEGVNATSVSEMSNRLTLVLEEVESDAFAARRDLEIMANDLLSLERDLFGG